MKEEDDYNSVLQDLYEHFWWLPIVLSVCSLTLTLLKTFDVI